MSSYMGMIRAAGLMGPLLTRGLTIKTRRSYGPCVGCGNPAKDNHCHKCRTKLSAIIQTTNQEGTSEPGTEASDFQNQIPVGVPFVRPAETPVQPENPPVDSIPREFARIVD